MENFAPPRPPRAASPNGARVAGFEVPAALRRARREWHDTRIEFFERVEAARFTFVLHIDDNSRPRFGSRRDTREEAATRVDSDWQGPRRGGRSAAARCFRRDEVLLVLDYNVDKRRWRRRRRWRRWRRSRSFRWRRRRARQPPAVTLVDVIANDARLVVGSGG